MRTEADNIDDFDILKIFWIYRCSLITVHSYVTDYPIKSAVRP